MPFQTHVTKDYVIVFQKTSKIPGVVGNGSASTRVGYSSYEDDDEDNATYEENAISHTNHVSRDIDTSLHISVE